MMAAGMKSVADKLYPAMGNNDSCHTLVLVKSDQIGSSRIKSVSMSIGRTMGSVRIP